MGIYFSYFLLFFYLILFAFFVKKYHFFSSNILSKNNIISLACMKMFAGILYIYLNQHHINGGDIFEYFKDGNIIYNQLWENPINYFKLTFLPNNISSYPTGTEAAIFKMGFWGDTGAYMIVRFNALIRPFSLGNIYIHGIVAGFLSFWGSFLILKVFEQYLNANKFVLLSIFLSPTLLFWTSGIHKEFVSVLALGLILYHFFQLVNRFNRTKSLFFFFLGFILFFFTRNYMLLALIPSLLSYAIHKSFRVEYKKSVLLSLILLIGFLNFQKIPSYNKTGLEVIVEKRQQFEDLKGGNTSIVLDKIEPNFISLLKNSPKALFNTILRPHFGEIKSTYLALASIESFILSCILLLALFNCHKLNLKESKLVIFMLLYAFTLLLIVGWIVPNIGAIVRYRSISLIILIPTLLHIVSKNKKISLFSK